MTKAKTIRAILRQHYHGKEFVAADIAARVGSAVSYAHRVLKDMPGVTVYKKPLENNGKGTGRGHLRDVTYYTFDANQIAWKGDKREWIEAVVKENEGKEFSASEVASQIGVSRAWALRVIQEIRGVKFVRAEKVLETKGRNGERHIYTFKPVSTDKWVA